VNPQAYALLGITALVAVLVAVVAWALLRFVSAARETRHRLRDTGGDSAMLMAHSLLWLCSGLAEERPLALVVDDAQWADRSSLEVCFKMHL